MFQVSIILYTCCFYHNNKAVELCGQVYENKSMCIIKYINLFNNGSTLREDLFRVVHESYVASFENIVYVCVYIIYIYIYVVSNSKWTTAWTDYLTCRKLYGKDRLMYLNIFNRTTFNYNAVGIIIYEVCLVVIRPCRINEYYTRYFSLIWSRASRVNIRCDVWETKK